MKTRHAEREDRGGCRLSRLSFRLAKRSCKKADRHGTQKRLTTAYSVDCTSTVSLILQGQPPSSRLAPGFLSSSCPASTPCWRSHLEHGGVAVRNRATATWESEHEQHSHAVLAAAVAASSGSLDIGVHSAMPSFHAMQSALSSPDLNFLCSSLALTGPACSPEASR